MLITVDRDPEYAPCAYLVCKVTGPKGRRDWNTRDESATVLIQTDYDWPGLASSFGWSPCCGSGSTDGTIACPDCGAQAGELIESAGEYLDALVDSPGEERFVQDPGYFD